jgi:hypothetical protein
MKKDFVCQEEFDHKILRLDFYSFHYKESCQRHNYYDIYLFRIFTLHRGSSG